MAIGGATIGGVYYLPSDRDTVGRRRQYRFATSVVARANGDPTQLATAMQRAGVIRGA